MKQLFFVTLFSIIALFSQAQNKSSSENNRIIIRETINVTTAYNAKKSKPGVFELATTKSGYKIFVQNKANASSTFIVRDPVGNIVTIIGRRKIINSENRTICFDCIKVNRPGANEEECFEVECTLEEKLRNTI